MKKTTGTNNATTGNGTEKKGETTINFTEMDEAMKKSIDEAMKKVMDDFKHFRETHTKEEWVEEADTKANTLKSVLAVTLEKIGRLTGCSKLKRDLQIIMESRLDKSSTAEEVIAMARKCRERVNGEIEIIIAFNDELALKEAMDLKRVIDAEGDTQDIFMSVASGFVWLAKKITRKIKDWTGKHIPETETMQELCKATSSFIALLKGTVKIGFNLLVTAGSFVLATGIKLAITIYHTVLNFFKQRIKDWESIRKTQVTSTPMTK